jgi:hypothetical protein
MSAHELAAHFVEPTHAALLATIIALVGALAWRSVRRSHAEERGAERKKKRSRP